MNLQNQNPEKNTNTKVQPPYPNRPIQIDEKEIEKEFQAEEGKKAESKAVTALCISIFMLIISSVPIIVEITDPSTPADHGLRTGFSTILLLIPDIAGIISVINLSVSSLGRNSTEKSRKIGIIALLIAILLLPLYFVIMTHLESK